MDHAPNGWPGILTGGSIVFFTYIGFDSVSTAAEECKRPQRDCENTRKTTQSDNGDRNRTSPSGGGPISINQRSGFRPDTVVLDVGPRQMQCLECPGSGLEEGDPKWFDSRVVGRKSVFPYSEVDRQETRRGPGQSVKQPALVSKCLPQRTRQTGIRFILCSACVRIWVWMP